MKVYIVGSGIAGIEAALTVSNKGFKTILIDENEIGGNYLNKTCLPSKLLIELSKNKNFLSSKKILLKKIKEIRNYYENLLDKQDVKFVKGFANIEYNEIKINSNKFELDLNNKAIICTGGKPIKPSIKGIENVLFSTEILDIQFIPDKVCIIGAGPEGIELCEIFSSFGSEVFLIEKKKRILEIEDEDISDFFLNILKNKNIKILTNKKVIKVEKINKELMITLDDLNKIKFDTVFSCVGWEANLNGIKSLLKNGKLIVDEKLKVNKKIYAAGDVISAGVANIAKEQGKIAALNALGYYKKFIKTNFPYSIFTSPQISSVGKKEKNLKNIEKFKILKIKFNDSIQGKILNDKGFLKLILKKDKIIGASCVSYNANDIINFISFIINNQISIFELSSFIPSNPSYYDYIVDNVRKIV